MANNTGIFFNINDNDGIPLVGVSTDGRVLINHLYGNCLIGSTTPTRTSSQPLQVTGGAYVSGNLGIGTTNPTSKLHVNGDVTITSDLYVGGTNTSGSCLLITNDGQEVFRPNGKILLRGGGGQSTRNSIELTNANGIVIDGGSSETYGVELKGGGGPVKVTQGNLLVGTSTPTGTASQTLQVNSGAYIYGNLGIGTTNPTAKVHICAVKTSDPGSAPLKIEVGTTLLATPEVGAIEYDGSFFYQTPNSTSGRAYVPPVYSFRLTANGSAIGPTIADFFTTPSSLSLEASSVYKITCFAYFTKTTAGTATWTHTFSSAPTVFTANLTYSPVTGIANGTQTNVLSYSGGQSTASMAHDATASLTTGVNHFAKFDIITVTNAATNWRLQLTQSAGTATPLAGSFYTVEKISTSTGTFVA